MALFKKLDSSNTTIIRCRDDDLVSILLTWIVQVTALAAAVTFGIFSVLSWTVAENAKEQANTSNLLAIAALCGSVANQDSAYNNEAQGFCAQLFPNAWTPLAGAVARSFPDFGAVLPPKVPSAVPSGTTTTPSSSFMGSRSPSRSTSWITPTSSTTIAYIVPLGSSYPGSSSTAVITPNPPTTTFTTSHPPTTSALTSTSTSHVIASHPTGIGPSTGIGNSGMSKSVKIGLSVGFVIAIPIILVTGLTYLRYRRLQREKVK